MNDKLGSSRRSRRTLVALASALALACGKGAEPPPSSPEPPAELPAEPSPQPPAPDVKGEEVTYSADGAELHGYLAYDAAKQGERPGVIVVHEWWGHNEYARERARALAALGYTALAVDMYGDGKLAEHPDDAKKFMGEVLSDMPGAVERFEAGKAVLAAHQTTNPDSIAAIGYCFGGAVVLHMARTGMALGGVASFHGVLATQSPAQKGEVKAKLLVMHGADDPLVPPPQVEAFKQEMSAAEADLKFIAYPGAVHAFTVPAATENGQKFGLPLAYDEAAAKQSWQELEAFLAKLYPEAS